MNTITLPELSLVVLVGPSGSGKSTFARQHFRATEVLSSDYCRGLVSDDENHQAATDDAFDVLHYVAAKRLARGRLVVVDATNVQPEARKPLVELARRYHVLPVALVLNLPEAVCRERNRERAGREFGPHVIRNQVSQLRRSLGSLQREGFRQVHVLDSVEAIADTKVERQRLWTDRRDETGPFDIIGDVHGCYDELYALLGELGYEDRDGLPVHPEGRRLIFLGDLVDRGPKVPDVLRLAMRAVEAGTAFCIPGNHDDKLLRALRGREVRIAHGLAESLAQIEQAAAEEPGFRERAIRFLDSLISHFVLDGGRLVVAHAGMKAEMQGRASGRVREFALYGETTGEMDDAGLPIRYNWAVEYRGAARVVYGHTPVVEPEWLNRTINIDTGCVFGGKLTALRYPELDLVSVPALRIYTESARWIATVEQERAGLTAQQRHDELLDLDDMVGKRRVETRLHGMITIREENAIAALEVMSRFAADPKWLIYLPPTMSPPEPSRREGLLEHPDEAFAYFRGQGVERVVCEEKHMGSRAVVIVCRGEETARRRFGVESGSGICYTRTGRRFFDEPETEAALLEVVRQGMEVSGLWQELETEWVCLDGELMPWSARAQGLLTGQYAPVGAAARAALTAAEDALLQARARGIDVTCLLESVQDRGEAARRYVAAYRRYCWPVRETSDLKLAPFHLLASEGKVHTEQPHSWHMQTLRRLCDAAEGILLATPCREVRLDDAEAVATAVDWWERLTAGGGEGMVVKPLEFVARGSRGLIQPAVKCRGREYLRIIYGPEYDAPENLERLRKRSVGAKRSLAAREFALGVEGLERFVRGEPLQRVHECAFAVLALESEPIDPRL